ncbi:MAG: fumarylacetoacetate hydrolase family protein [Planctomycetota bacterium]|jgi:2-keto-4-pentenoate hydratase/2-oxohepta-3-ene-1,7-dioic acid hydratase in catechol pathway|nr:fumarylacetoacetate hydrolase family protein [Planctomycetota bacterium]
MLQRGANIFCLGKNFADHARELGSEPPSSPIWFTKLASTFIGNTEEVMIPDWLHGGVDCEAEIAILVDSELYQSTATDCQSAISAYTCANDITARSVQSTDRDQGLPWFRAKNVHSFGAIGPQWLKYPGEEMFSQLELCGRVNGEIVQLATLGDMIFSPADALSELSRWHKIRPGDVLLLGTPAGVRKIFPGDILEVSCGELLLTNTVA